MSSKKSSAVYVHEVDYVVHDGVPVVRVFGRDLSGRSVISRFSDFLPYFYCMPETGADAGKLMRRILSPEVAEPSHVIGAGIESKHWEGRKADLVRVTIDSPRNVRSSRSNLGKIPAVEDTYEKDILFKRRFIIDNGVQPLSVLSITGQEIESKLPVGYVVEDCGIEGIEDNYLSISDLRLAVFDIEVSCSTAPDSEKDPIIMIGMLDGEGKRILTWQREFPGAESLEDEGSMLKRFMDIINEKDYDVLMGYNSDSFDLPYMKTRARVNGLRLVLGRDLSEVGYRPGPITGRSIIKGRINVDLYQPVRRMLNLPSYRLCDVYEHLSGRTKKELDMVEVHDLWESGEALDGASIADYCSSDVEATMLIAREILPTLLELSKTTKLLLSDVARMGQSQLVEWLLIREAHRRGILVPNKPRSPEMARRRRETYEGGYVLEPRKGLQGDMVSLDFRSLYPTIIVTHNVDPSTMDCECCEGTNVSPTGQHFCTQKPGFIPSILSGLVERRSEIKQEMSRMDEKDQKYSIRDAMQKALKILSNSFYGYTGYPAARWYSRECAQSVAAWGREYIRTTIETAKSEGFQVLYSDTDSLFISKTDYEGEGLIDEADQLLGKLNSSLPGIIQLEYQGHYPRGFFVTKKRYALIDDSGEIFTKGLEVVRRDWSPIAKDTQRRVIRAILEDGDPQRAAEEVRGSVKAVSERSVPLEDLVIRTTMTKDIEDYESEAPHVALARRLELRGHEIKKGATIEYVVVKGQGKVGDRARLAEDVDPEDYDIDYYIENQILPPSMRILQSFGYRVDDLKYHNTKQQTLDLFG